jgi:hypothetical protein
MKKIFFVLPAFAVFCLTSCEQDDSPGDNYDFSSTMPAYVALSSTTAKTVRQGNSTTFTFQTRTAMQQPITVTYNVAGAVTLSNQTVVIDRDKTSAVATVNIPAGVIVPPATTATATLTVVKAVTADGIQLTLGQKNNPASQKVTINIIP